MSQILLAGLAASSSHMIGTAPRRSPLHVCVMSDRLLAITALVKSVHASKRLATSLEYVIITTIPEASVLDAMPRLPVRVIAFDHAVKSLVARGVVPVWLWQEWQDWLDWLPSARWRTNASLRPFPASRDPKHAHPLNLLRLYLAELPALQQLDRLLLLDDDVLIQHDIAPLFDTPLATDTLLQASCSMYHLARLGDRSWLNLTSATLTYSATSFIGAIGPQAYPVCRSADASGPCAPAALEPLLLSLESETNRARPSSLREQLAWNFGVALLPLDRWRAQALVRRVQRWLEANLIHRLFPPDSLASGLGIPYLIFAGSVGCWREEVVLDGLGFVSSDDLESSGVQDLGVYIALHFAGPDKPTLAGLEHGQTVQMLAANHLERTTSRRRMRGYLGYGYHVYGGYDLLGGDGYVPPETSPSPAPSKSGSPPFNPQPPPSPSPPRPSLQGVEPAVPPTHPLGPSAPPTALPPSPLNSPPLPPRNASLLPEPPPPNLCSPPLSTPCSSGCYKDPGLCAETTRWECNRCVVDCQYPGICWPDPAVCGAGTYWDCFERKCRAAAPSHGPFLFCPTC